MTTCASCRRWSSRGVCVRDWTPAPAGREACQWAALDLAEPAREERPRFRSVQAALVFYLQARERSESAPCRSAETRGAELLALGVAVDGGAGSCIEDRLADLADVARCLPTDPLRRRVLELTAGGAPGEGFSIRSAMAVLSAEMRVKVTRWAVCRALQIGCCEMAANMRACGLINNGISTAPGQK